MSGAHVPPTLTNADAHERASEPVTLVVLEGPDAGAQLPLTAGVHVVGTDPGAALRLSDPRVSRKHLVFHVSERGVHARDPGSKNGSFVAGARLSEAVLAPGSTVRIGGTLLSVTPAHAAPRTFGALVGRSAAMLDLFALLARVAPSPAHVLIEAETGCGKELCAEAIHAASARAAGPFVICDMASITKGLIESELFGHTRGAFTGANAARAGAFVEAHGGTLFIDEIGELDLELQPRLLRALDTLKVKPVGGDAYRAVDVRIVAATNRNLEEEVRAGRFREDLFYRLAVARVPIPPLRERKDDVALLARAFIGARDVFLPPETLGLLEAYDWPGNVRELRNVVEGAVARMGDRGGELAPSMLSIDRGGDTALPWPKLSDKQRFVDARNRLINAWERAYLEQLLARCEGNVSRAAREGGLERVYLHRLLRRHNLGRTKS